MTDRCENCDKPTATQAEYDTIPEGDGQHLCWRSWNHHDRCEEPTADWRARALAAESALHAMRLAYLDDTHGDRDPSTVSAADIKSLREVFKDQGTKIREQVIRIEGYERENDDLRSSHHAMYDVVTAAMACRTASRGSPQDCINKGHILVDAVDEYINRYIVS